MYHSSPEEIKEIKSNGLYGTGLFFGPSSSCGFGQFVYELDSDSISICTVKKLRYEFDETEKEAAEYAKKWSIDTETAFDIITGKENEYDHIDSCVAGEAGWEAQKIALILAMRAGYEAVELVDENGAVWLVDANAAAAKWRLANGD